MAEKSVMIGLNKQVGHATRRLNRINQAMRTRKNRERRRGVMRLKKKQEKKT
jgi:hypothetical protein